MRNIIVMLMISFLLFSCRIEKDSLQTWTIKRIKINGIVKFKNHQGKYKAIGTDTLKEGDKIQVMINSTAPHIENLIRIDTMHLRKRIIKTTKE